MTKESKEYLKQVRETKKLFRRLQYEDPQYAYYWGLFGR